MKGLFPFVFSLLCALEAWSARNITIDDNSPLIQYEGQWDRSGRNDYSYGGTHVSSTVPGSARATLSFNGTAVYFVSPRWSIPIAVTLSLDGRPPDIVDLQTTVIRPEGWESEVSAPRWGILGLKNGEHTLRVSYGQPSNATGAPAQFTVVDAFIYTVEDENPSSTSSSSPPTGSPSETSAPASTSPSNVPLIAGLVSALVSTSLITVFAVFLFWRRRKRQAYRGVLPAGFSVDDSDDSSPSPSALTPYPISVSSGPSDIAVIPQPYTTSMSDFNVSDRTPLSPSLKGAYPGETKGTNSAQSSSKTGMTTVTTSLFNRYPGDESFPSPPAYPG